MEGRFISAWILTVCVIVTVAAVHGGEYYSKTVPSSAVKEQVTNLHFFFHGTHGGRNPTSVLVAKPNLTDNSKSPVPFGSVIAVDNPLTAGPEITSEVIGNARGLFLSAAKDTVSLVVYFDFGFTKGEFNGSSISVFSRSPVLETERELAVVGGRGKFRMARGFAQLKTYDVNKKNRNAIVEYNVTVFHY